MRVASTAVSIVPWPDIITTGMPSWPLAAHSLSSEMPSVSGIQMSSSARSGPWCPRDRGASRAPPAGRTWWPSSARISESSSRIPTSSSTTRICAMASGRLRHRQQDADRGAPCKPVLDRQLAVVLVDDLLDDRQAEARAARLGGHIGLENPRHHLLRKTAAIVGHRQAHPVAGGLGADLHDRLLAGGP